MMTSIRMLFVMTLLTGLAYPLVTTALAQLLFPWQANGSRLVREGRVTGSVWLGQHFDQPAYFWPRPSATGPFPYNALASSGSNYGPLNEDAKKLLAARRAALQAADPGNQRPIPLDLLTASASGLDPHISPAAAAYQAPRIARVRALPLAEIERLIARHTLPRQFGVLGEPVVNVLLLNHDLDRRGR
jgi:potassium-transporting ATPase KdpC subunit